MPRSPLAPVLSRLLSAGLVLSAGVLAGCGGPEPDNSRWESAQEQTADGGRLTDAGGMDDSDGGMSGEMGGGDLPPVGSPDGAEPAAAAASEGAVAVAEDLPSEPVDSGDFNKFFPEQGGGYDRVFRQEKRGTAIADLEKDEVVVVQLSVTDLAVNPRALEKYRTATMEIDGYPAVTQGSKTTALLVNGRYQVKASSKDDSFTAADRETWLEKFDLAGLAAMDALK